MVSVFYYHLFSVLIVEPWFKSKPLSKSTPNKVPKKEQKDGFGPGAWDHFGNSGTHFM